MEDRSFQPVSAPFQASMPKEVFKSLAAAAPCAAALAAVLAMAS